MNEIDDAAFERAYQRMMFRRNQEAIQAELDRSARIVPEIVALAEKVRAREVADDE